VSSETGPDLVTQSAPAESRAALRHRRERERPRVLRIIGLSLTTLLFVFVLFIAVIAIVIPKIASAVPLTVLTQSMEPSLPPGTIVVVKPIDPEKIKIGDVITYQIKPGEPDVITHRVIGITHSTVNGLSFTLKGDNNSDADPAVIPAQIQGIVWYSIPWIGTFTTAFSAGARDWILPVAGFVLIAIAGYLIASGIVDASRKGRTNSNPRRRK
jgi:signal peptidase